MIAVPDPSLRDQLEALAHASIQQASWQRGVAMLDSDVAAFRQRLLDDLLPLIAAHVEAAAATRAQQELLTLARTALARTPGFDPVLIPVADVYARADALGQP